MIDEELYQFATEELNSDRRNSELWNRACALAQDDHDEARYLYTNIRVEELLEQHAKGEPLPLMPSLPKKSAPVAKTAPPKGLENDLSLDFDASALDNSATDTVSSSNRAFGANFAADDLPSLDNTGEMTDTQYGSSQAELTTGKSAFTDKSTPADLVAKDDLLLSTEPNAEDTTASVRGTAPTMDLSESPTDFDIDAVKAMNNEDGADAKPTLSEDSRNFLDLDALPSVDPEISSLAASASQTLSDDKAQATSVDDFAADEDAQAFIDKNSNSASTADRPLMDQTLDATANGADSDATGAELKFLDGSSPGEHLDTAGQADGLTNGMANDLASDSPNDLPSLDGEEEARARQSALSENLEHEADTWLPTDGDSTGTAHQSHAPVVQDYSAPGAGATHSMGAMGDSEQAELMTGPGRLYRVFSRGPDDTRAVRRGMSWTAMFFTLPWLLVKRMPGTAIVYALLWIVAVGGLLISGIHWLDTSTTAPSIAALWPLGFAVLAVIGLIILPLFMANRWHASSLMGRGYEEIATVRAKSHNRAIDRIVQMAA